MTEERLARRYRNLLGFYPRAYRAERGDELVGTLLECSRPAQARPTWRESRSLVLEGLRMRAGTSARRPFRAVLLDGLHLVVLLLIAYRVLGAGTELLRAGFGPEGHPVPIAGAVLLAGAVPFVLVALGRFAAALPLLALGAVASILGDHFLDPTLVASVVAVVAAVALWWLQPMATRVGPGIVGCAVVPPLLHHLPTWLAEFGHVQASLFVLMYLGALVYVPVDPRPAMAMAALVLVDAADSIVVNGEPALLVYAVVLPAVTFAAALIGARRQARSGPVDVRR